MLRIEMKYKYQSWGQTNGSGVIDFIEYVQLMDDCFWREESIRDAFEVFDLDGSGTIDVDQFRIMMTECGYDDFSEEIIVLIRA